MRNPLLGWRSKLFFFIVLGGVAKEVLIFDPSKTNESDQLQFVSNTSSFIWQGMYNYNDIAELLPVYIIS